MNCLVTSSGNSFTSGVNYRIPKTEIQSQIIKITNHWNTNQQSVTKFMGKTAIWTIFCFSFLPSLNNVEEQWAKVAPSDVMGS